MAKFFLRPVATISSTNMTAFGAATLHECLDDYPNSSGFTTDAAVADGNNSVALSAFLVSFESLPAIPMVINLVKVRMLWGGRGPAGVNPRNTRVQAKSGATTSYDATQAMGDGDGTPVERAFSLTTDPNTGQPWTTAAVNVLQAGADENQAGIGAGFDYVRHSALCLEVDAVPISARLEQAREIGSLALLTSHRGRLPLEIDGPAEFLDLELGSFVSLWHRSLIDPLTRLPLPQARGYRRHYELLESQPDVTPQGIRARLWLRDLRDGFQLVTDYDTGLAQGSASPFGNGVARITAGAVRTYSRTGNAYVEDPSDGRVVIVEPGFGKFDRYGQALERAAANGLANGNFAAGTSGCTLSGGATTVVPDTSIAVWDASLVPGGGIKLDTNAGGTTPSIARTTVTSYTGLIHAWMTHKDVVGGRMDIRIRRTIDNFYLTVATGAWGAGIVDNPVTVRSAAHFRDIFNSINVGAGATTITVTARGGSSAAGRTWELADWGVDAGAYPTTRVLAETRAADNLGLVAASQAAASWPMAQASGYLEFIPFWTTAEQTSTVYLLAVDFDANNAAYIRWNGASGRYEFVLKAAATSYTAYIAFTNGRGTAVRIAWRKAGVEGDLGLAAHTMSIWANDVQGTDAVGVVPTETYPATLYVGSKDGSTGHCDGYMSLRKITPFVATAAEIARKLQ